MIAVPTRVVSFGGSSVQIDYDGSDAAQVVDFLYRDVPHDERVPPHVTPNRITGSGLDRAWQRARDKAGLPGRIPHDFRRTAVRNLEQAGVPRSVAMKLTGHKTEAVYRRYAIVSPGDLRSAARQLDAYTQGTAGTEATRDAQNS